MEKIPTAEEFADKYELTERQGQSAGHINYVEVYNFAIGFAKLHVQAALEAAIKNAKKAYFNADKPLDAILNAYPLENIK